MSFLRWGVWWHNANHQTNNVCVRVCVCVRVANNMRTDVLTYARSSLGTTKQANALVDVAVHKLEQKGEHW